VIGEGSAVSEYIVDFRLFLPEGLDAQEVWMHLVRATKHSGLEWWVGDDGVRTGLPTLPIEENNCE
jgi:hypothetical protein